MQYWCRIRACYLLSSYRRVSRETDRRGKRIIIYFFFYGSGRLGFMHPGAVYLTCFLVIFKRSFRSWSEIRRQSKRVKPDVAVAWKMCWQCSNCPQCYLTNTRLFSNTIIIYLMWLFRNPRQLKAQTPATGYAVIQCGFVDCGATQMTGTNGQAANELSPK